MAIELVVVVENSGAKFALFVVLLVVISQFVFLQRRVLAEGLAALVTQIGLAAPVDASHVVLQLLRRTENFGAALVKAGVVVRFGLIVSWRRSKI